MILTVETKQLIELLTDALQTVGIGIRIGTGRGHLGDEPGEQGLLTATSSTGFVMGHCWIPCISNGVMPDSVWPEDSARNVLAICKSLSRKGSDDQQHTVDISLDRAPIVDGVTGDDEHPGWTVTMQETPALFDSDTEFQFHAHHESRFPVGRVAEILAGGYTPDVRYKSVPLTQWSPSVLKPIVAVAARRRCPIQMFRATGRAVHLVQIGDSWLGAATQQLPDSDRPADGPSIEPVLTVEEES